MEEPGKGQGFAKMERIHSYHLPDALVKTKRYKRATSNHVSLGVVGQSGLDVNVPMGFA